MNRRGFTLLEVLLSIVIFSVVMAAIYSTFFLSEKSISGMDSYGLRLEEGRRFLDILSGEIRSAVYRKDNANSIFLVKDRESYGRPTSELTFTTLGAVSEGIYRMDYYVGEDSKGLRLYKRITSVYNNAGSMDSEVMEDIDSFLIKIRDKDEWAGTWDTELTKKLPEEVRVIIRLKLKNKVVELSQTVKPRMEL